MATQGKFMLTGISGWLEDLAQASGDIDGSVKEVLVDAASEVQAEMRNLVPIDTGNLYEHIQVLGPYQEGNFSYVDVGVIHDRSFTDADTAIYGNVMEYGSARTAAQPYIRPALKRKKGVMKKALQRLLQKYGLST